MEKRDLRSWVALALAGPVLCLCSCRKESSTPSWDVDAVIPLVNTSLGLGDLVADSLLASDADGNISLRYTTRLFELKLDTVLATPDTSFRYRYPPFDLGGATLDIFPGTMLNATNDVTRFDLDQLELRELRVRSGTLGITLTNRLATDIFADLALPGASLNGAPLALHVTAPAGSPADPGSVSATEALDGYTFDMRGPLFNDVNSLATAITYTTATDGPVVHMTAADSLEALVFYQDIVPQYARGYFGNRAIDIAPDTTLLEVFSNLSGVLDVDVAAARLTMRNGVGVDARARIQYIHGVNSRNGSVVPLQHTITSSAINLDRAVDLGNSFQTAENTFDLNTANSNLDQFIENLPDRIAYAVDLTIDPLGDVSNGNDFLYYESQLTGDLEIDVPLRLITTDLTLSKTSSVSLPGTRDHHAFQSGTLHFFATNGFPFSATARLRIDDAMGNELATLTPGGTIAAAHIGLDGTVTSAAYSEVRFDLSADQVDMLYGTNRLRITAIFNTASQTQHVVLRADQRLDVQVTFEGNYLVNGDE